MNHRSRALACALCIVTSSAALAQTTTAVLGPAASENMLRSGTPISLKLDEALTTEHKALRAGQHFKIEVAEDVRLNGNVVIPAGSAGEGEVTDVRNKGAWGKSGHISARVLWVRVNDRQIRLTGVFDEKGTTGTAGVVAAIAFVPIAGFAMTGTSARIPLGAPIKGFVDEDIPVTFASTGPAPMVVSQPVAAPAATMQPAVVQTAAKGS